MKMLAPKGLHNENLHDINKIIQRMVAFNHSTSSLPHRTLYEIKIILYILKMNKLISIIYSPFYKRFLQGHICKSQYFLHETVLHYLWGSGKCFTERAWHWLPGLPVFSLDEGTQRGGTLPFSKDILRTELCLLCD